MPEAQIIPLKLTPAAAIKMIREIAADTNNIVIIGYGKKADASAADQPSSGRALCSERDHYGRSVHESARQLATQSLSPCRWRGDYVRDRDRLAEQVLVINAF